MVDPFAWLAGWLHENLLLPVLWQFGWMEWDDAAFMWALFAVYGVLQVVINLAVCLPAERLRPLQRGRADGRVAIDVFYTLVARVGIFPLATFFGFYALQTWLNGMLADHGLVPLTLDRLFPVLMGMPAVTFLIYAVVLDGSDYWRHRFSHRIGWWYGLHSVHHAQTRMTFWSDDRNHVLDDLIAYVWVIATGLVIGIPPMQFPLLVLVLRLVESLSHANTSIGFGWLGERLLVSPQFHRAHHGLLASGQQSFNYGAVFPWWDMMLGTARFRHDVIETGDAGAPAAMTTGSWLDQQIAGVTRAWSLAGRRRPAVGIRPASDPG